MKNLKINTIYSVIDGSIFATASGMLATNTVIVYFISKYVTTKTLIGLLTTVNVLLSNSAQILMAKRLEESERYKPLLFRFAVLLRFTWFLLACNVFLFAERNNTLFIILFYLIFSLQGLFNAFTSFSWYNLILKVVPERYRSRFFGIRSTFGGIFETLGAFLMGKILKLLPYPYNYSLLFLTAFLIMMISLYFLMQIKEPVFKKPKIVLDKKEYYKNMLRILKEDKNFTMYLLSVVFIGSIGKMPFGFQTIFAKELLHISAQDVAMATTILLFSQTIGYMIWGIVGTKKGFKATIAISAVIFLPALYFTFSMHSKFIYFISISLFGLAQSARNVNESNLAANLCKDPLKQPSYIGLRNFLMGPFFAFNPMIAGAIIDILNARWLFYISTTSMLIGLIIVTFFVKENKA